jgi:hypothetical protein
METECVYCAVRVEYLSISQGNLRATIKHSHVCLHYEGFFFLPFLLYLKLKLNAYRFFFACVNSE